jgi:GWxTD domain-containing protein
MIIRFLLSLVLSAFSLNMLSAKGGITASIAHEVFMSQNRERYLETWLWIDGNSLTYKNVAGGEQASVELIISISQADEIITYDKIELQSSLHTVGSTKRNHLFNLRRFALEKGSYQLDIYLKDMHLKNAKHLHYTDSVEVLFTENQIGISSVLFLEHFKILQEPSATSRGLLDFHPNPGFYFGQGMDTLRFYTEIYSADLVFGSESPYVSRYFLRRLGDDEPVEGFGRMRREKAGAVKPILAELNITELKNGHYEVVVEVINSEGEVVSSSSRYFFRDSYGPIATEDDLQKIQLTGTFMDRINGRDTLEEMVRCLFPIIGGNELTFADNIRKSGDINLMKRYLFNFWSRKGGENNPEAAWKVYQARINGVNKEFSTPTSRGYETDRGRIYLQYGPPNTVNKRYFEPSAFPYEIWHYHQLRSQANVRFVFYNPSSMDNDFVLIHSDLRGEINNRQWEMFVFNRNNSWNVDQNNVNRHYGNWSSDLFYQPR